MMFLKPRLSDEATVLAVNLIGDEPIKGTKTRAAVIESMTILLCNLSILPADEWLTITFNSQLLSEYNLPQASKMLSALELLHKSNLIQWEKGERNSRKMHRIKALPDLLPILKKIDKSMIYIQIEKQIEVRGKKNKKGDRGMIKTPFNRVSWQMEKDLSLINTVYRNARIEFPLNHLDPELDLTMKQVYRIFHEDLSHHGRFYGCWWMSAEAEHRPSIKINGDPTVEIDFSGMHPSILYALAGLPVPEGLYKIKGYSRGLVKILFLIMLNTKNADHACQSLRGNFKEYATRTNKFIKPLIAKIQQKHSLISHHFFNKVFSMLTRIDSAIAHKVIMHFAHRGIVCLSIHDSFIVPTRYTRELETIMHESFDVVIAEEMLKVRPKQPTLTCQVLSI